LWIYLLVAGQSRVFMTFKCALVIVGASIFAAYTDAMLFSGILTVAITSMAWMIPVLVAASALLGSRTVQRVFWGGALYSFLIFGYYYIQPDSPGLEDRELATLLQVLIVQIIAVSLLGLSSIFQAQMASQKSRVEVLEATASQLRKSVQNAASAYNNVDHANQSKTVLIANMSQELQAALNNIIGFSEAMEMELYGSLGSSKYQEYVAYIRESGSQLLNFVDGLRRYSSLENKPDPQSERLIDLSTLAATCIRDITNEYSRDQAGDIAEIVENIPDTFPRLRGNITAISEILRGLISSALRTTPADGTVTISCEINKFGLLILTVADNGLGLSEEELSAVEQLYFKPDEDVYTGLQSYSVLGMGLGMTMARALAELHQGRIEIDSDHDRGTTATVIFPSERVVRS